MHSYAMGTSLIYCILPSASHCVHSDSRIPAAGPPIVSPPPSSRRVRKPRRAPPLEIAVHRRSANEPRWAVDRIVRQVEDGGKRYYIVRWEDTLEPVENLRGCADAAIAEFHLRRLDSGK